MHTRRSVNDSMRTFVRAIKIRRKHLRLSVCGLHPCRTPSRFLVGVKRSSPPLFCPNIIITGHLILLRPIFDENCSESTSDINFSFFYISNVNSTTPTRSSIFHEMCSFSGRYEPTRQLNR